MEKIKAIQNTAKLCWKCLKEKEPLHIIKFGPLGYGSSFDNCQTKIQLCEECFQKSNPDIWSEEIVYMDLLIISMRMKYLHILILFQSKAGNLYGMNSMMTDIRWTHKTGSTIRLGFSHMKWQKSMDCFQHRR